MSDNKRNRSSKGYYIALILSAAAIWITGYVFYRNTNQQQEVSIAETYEDVVVGTVETGDVAVIATNPSTQATTATVPVQPPASAPTTKKPLKTASPVSGDTIFGYSMEALSYNQTTRDWRVHNGIDLTAEAGTQVMAAADGKVHAVYEDDAMGPTVVIHHEEGYTTQYCSLAEDIPVKPGDQVTLGQVIGYAADTAMVERALGSHVHFSVTQNGQPMDPGVFLALGS